MTYRDPQHTPSEENRPTPSAATDWEEGRPRPVQQPCAPTAREEGRPRPVTPDGVFSVWLIFATALVTALLWRWWCVPYGDDYIYSHMFETDGMTRQSNNWLGPPIATLGDAWTSTCRHYMTGPGRLANSLSFFMALLPHWLVVAIGATAVAAQPLLAAMVAGGRRALKRPTALAALYILMWLLLPWSDHMQSIVFLTNYALSACAILLAMLLFDHRLGGGPSPARPAPETITCCLIVLLASWMHEGFSVALIAWMVGRLTTDYLSPGGLSNLRVYVLGDSAAESRRPQLLMLLSALLGFALSLSPGTWGRIGESTGSGLHIPVQDILLLVPVAVLAIITLWLLMRRNKPHRAASHNPTVPHPAGQVSRDAIMALIPYWLGIGANLAVVLASHASGRALWPAILLSLTAIWHLIYRHKPMRPNWLWLPLTVVYALMMTALISAQAAVSDVHHRIHPLLGASPIVYSDSAYTTAPWYTFGIPLTDKYTDRINLHFERQAALVSAATQPTPSQPGATVLGASAPSSGRQAAHAPATAIILPTACRDLPWREWPKVPGDNPYRGSLAHMVTTDSIDTPLLHLHMGAPLSSMSPLKHLITNAYHTVAPAAQLTVRPTLERVCILNGDTLYRVSLPPLPYLWSDRPVTAVDLIR